MKELFGGLGNNPKFNTLVKLAFYSLFVFAAIIFINIAGPSELNNEVDNNNGNNDELKIENISVTLPDNYEYVYNINVDDKIYSYQGIVENAVNNFKKNKDNKIISYKYEDDKYYLLKKEEYVEVSESDVYDIVNYEYLSIDKINQYLNNSKKAGGKYYIYLKDVVTGEATDIYIEIILDENKVTIDYSKIDDEFQKFIVEFEFKERNKEGEKNES